MVNTSAAPIYPEEKPGPRSWGSDPRRDYTSSGLAWRSDRIVSTTFQSKSADTRQRHLICEQKEGRPYL